MKNGDKYSGICHCCRGPALDQSLLSLDVLFEHGFPAEI